MAFVHGKDTKVYVNGYDLTSYFRQADTEGSRGVADATTFGKTTREFLVGIVDGTLSLEGLFDGAANAVDEVLQPILGTNNTIWNLIFGGDTLGNRGAGFSANATAYKVGAPTAEVVRVMAEAQSNVGREGIVVHKTLAAVTGTTTGAAQDGGAATTNGGVAYQHVTAIAGAAPSVVVTIQDSADGSTDWQTILTMTAVTAARAKERVAITGTVRRYTRAVTTFGGTTTSITNFVGFDRK